MTSPVGSRTASIPPGDDRLMTRMQGGDVEAFDELYDLYCDRAYRVALSICLDASHADEAVQEAFLSIWRSRASYQRNRCSVAAWLLTLVRERAMDGALPGDKHAGHRPGHEVLHALPDALREVITLSFYGHLTHTEISQQLDLPSETVRGECASGCTSSETAKTVEARRAGSGAA